MTVAGDEVVAPEEPYAGAAHESVGLGRARRRSVVLAVVLLAVAVVLLVPLVRSPTDPWYQRWDDDWRAWMTMHRSASLVDVAEVLAVVGSVWVTVPLRLTAAGILLARRRWTQLAAFGTAIVLSELAIGPVKAWLDRPRPPGAPGSIVSASFPSGHAIAMSVTAFGLVAAFLPRGTRRWHWFVAATIAASSMAWSRTYLSAHWASDTVAGTCIGVGVALLSEAVFEGGRHLGAELAELDDAADRGGSAEADA